MPPSHPYLASISAHDIPPVRSLNGKIRHLLQLLAETFEFELQRERQLQSRGTATLPLEWTAYLERERQEILDKIQQTELLEEHYNALSNTAQSQVSDSFAHPFTTPALLSAHTRYDDEVHPGGSIPHAIRSVSEPARQLGSTIAGHSRPEESIYPFVLSGTAAHTCSTSHATIPDGSLRSTSPALYSTVHRHEDTGSDRERVRRSPASMLGCPCIDHGIEQGGSSPRASSSRMDPRRVERVGYQPHAEMFNGAQSTTINGGVIYLVQGDLSHVSPTQSSHPAGSSQWIPPHDHQVGGAGHYQ